QGRDDLRACQRLCPDGTAKIDREAAALPPVRGLGDGREPHRGLPRLQRLPGVAQTGRSLLRRAARSRARLDSHQESLEVRVKTSTSRILTTHTGSLPRTAKVVELLVSEQHKPGTRKAELAAAVKEAVAHVVAKQIEAGIDVINDGEQGRTDYTVHVLD